MKRAFYLLSSLMLVFTTSCVDSLEEYNVDAKRATVVPGVTLVTTAERAIARTVTSTNVNLNPFRFYVQYWTETTYTDETNYDIQTRQINNAFWNALYLNSLGNLNEARRVITSEATADKVKANQLACVEILSVYTWKTLVDTYGNVPYTEALDFTKPQPAYDDAKTIYASLFTRLDAALASLDPTAAGLGSADVIYRGDIAKWRKFGNSLKLRMALTIADDDVAKARTAAVQAAPGVFTSNADNAEFAFLSSVPNTNPLYEDLVNSGRQDFVGASPFIDVLNTLQDPRRSYYFKEAAPGRFIGGVYGALNDYDDFSAPGAALEDPTLPGVLLSYSEVEFLLAESVERGFAVGGTAASHYNAAVTASILHAGGTQAAAATYLARPTVAYATATGTYKQKIGVQKWIALYDQPVVAWTEWRRLDSPSLVKPANALSDIPKRFTYPTPELNQNGANAKSAGSAIGGDVVTTKIFWDKF
ncbi:SusD/RagB family nutrient-binding outer membrane lipoprotein [Hymenobacter arizonensis]|uniref:Susd and RagB outer membrane lipoprotein n=1 Tax=Hymenobacter arizonensis TaxID=1227077 RepID=A0A1I6AY30_HYMAR|nr:SusD/RagB family nutrient-binding outer membrane lipoprotein [Hymenobacter arizonensis]SFQ73594.1 Susd and RagB outer membrane lipoprotein [Hymenobacter arizonensis]